MKNIITVVVNSLLFSVIIPGSAGGQQQEKPKSDQVHQHFSKEMTIVQLSQWLTNHPNIGTDYQEDISELKGSQIILLQ